MIPGIAEGDIETEKLWNSSLFLDIRDVASAWSELDLREPLQLKDISAGLSVGVGVLGLLAGQIPNSAVWCTGPISNPVEDRYRRCRILPSTKEPLINDVMT